MLMHRPFGLHRPFLQLQRALFVHIIQNHNSKYLALLFVRVRAGLAQSDQFHILSVSESFPSTLPCKPCSRVAFGRCMLSFMI